MATRKKRGRIPENFEKGGVIDITRAREKRQAQREMDQKKSRKKKKKTAQKKKVSERQSKRLSKRMAICLAVSLVIFFMLIGSLYNLFSLRQQEQLEKQKLDALNEKKTELQQQVAGTTSDAAMEKEARDLLKMIKPGEMLYVLPDGKSTTTGSGTETGK